MTNKVSDCSTPDKNCKSGNMESAKNRNAAGGMESSSRNVNGAKNRASGAECGNMESGATNRAASGAANSSSKGSYVGVSDSESAAGRRFRCKNCGTVFNGSKAPSKCPKCDSSEFSAQ